MNERSSQEAAPLFFQDILGQERVLSQLKAARRSERLAHAYLFLGLEGVGRASTARALAAALNCENPREDGDACGECPSCLRLAAGTQANFQTIIPTSEGRQPQIKIEQIRELRRQMGYPPLDGGWRVVLLKPGETLNDASANALLKTLEEPPPRHVLILTAQGEADLFPTIVSRCQKLNFAPLPQALVARELMRRRHLPGPQAALLAALSGGSLGRALALEPEALVSTRTRVLQELAAFKAGGASQVLTWAGRLAKNREDLDNFLLLTQLWYRDLLLVHFGSPPQRLAHQDCLEELKKEAGAGQPRSWFAHLNALREAHRALGANLNPELTLDILGLRLQHPGPTHEHR